eukprot:TRINITY_DN2627_c0_g3_i4.p1 TRINITY_DN2627_c0_g3~~TRINITY_DN2627_c0_g3_i4.p1  ORF type:complete len:798 (+),score=353.20 TRINITY_DN2627_c0_g3_i4:43-2394(+)
MASTVDLFQKIGLSKEKAEETIKNKVLTKHLEDVIHEAGVANGCSKETGMLLYTIATKYPGNALKHRALLNKYVADQKIKQNTQLVAAMAYLKSVTDHGEVDVAKFEEASGVGVVYTDAQLFEAVKEVLSSKIDEIKQGKDNVGVLLGLVRKNLVWAEPKVVTDELNKQLATLKASLPPPPSAAQTAEAEAKKKEEERKKKEEARKAEEAAKKAAKETTLSDSVHFPPPERNYQKQPHLLEKHLKETGGLVRTRFPPEPNGFLHIGHAKSMNLNFNYAKKHKGVCYLRYDDTNPEKEKQVYIDAIADGVAWLGHKPWKVTYASDYFDQLYEYALVLIKKEKAFVCHETKEQMKEGRENKRESPYRNRSVEENLKLFQAMKDGKLEAGSVVLRLKIDMTSPNPCMRDPVAYRIKFVPHPHVGDKWCIYPSYDYTHCICDSIENITHSLCTLEFEVRREVYNWVLETLEIYRPPQIEFARLRLTKTVISKRFIKKLVEEGYVKGWDDPRLSTLMALRRRGYTPEAINSFCEAIGISRHDSVLDYLVLEEFVRKDLDVRAKRALVVLNPLKVVITNIPEGEVQQLTVKNHPTDESLGTRQVPFSRVVYIERSDFDEANSKIITAKGKEEEFFGLAPGKEVRLKYAFIIKCEEVIKDKAGNVVEIRATCDPNSKSKPKGTIHWVGQPKAGQDPATAEIRLYKQLMKVDEVDTSSPDWVKGVDTSSLSVISNALIEESLKGAQKGEKFQFERQGFFCADFDSTDTKKVFNLTVGLKDAIASSKSTKSK